MLLYNWKKIFLATDGSPYDIVLIFKMMTKGLIPQNKYDRIYKYYIQDFSGTSYLVHPDVLLYNLYKYEYREVAQYLALASLRSYADYLSTNDSTLPLHHAPMDRELFDNNRLLSIDDDTIHFIYEEVTETTTRH